MMPPMMDYYRRDYYGAPPPPPQMMMRRPPRPVYRGTDEERSRSMTLFVGNLPYSMIEPDIDAIFARFGKLRKITLPMDRFTGRNRGFAFVEFEERRDAEDAFAKYNETSLEGRRLRLDWDVSGERRSVVNGGPGPQQPPTMMDDRPGPSPSMRGPYSPDARRY